MNIYQDNGYENREEYLKSLAEDYGLSLMKVRALAEILGEEEDFDGLVTSVQDAADGLD